MKPVAMESFVSANERELGRQREIGSIRNFKRAPFEDAPPTHLPIGFLFWFHALLLIIITLVAVITRYVNLSDYDYVYYPDVYAFFSQEMTWRVFWRVAVYATIGAGASFALLLCWCIGVWIMPLFTVRATILLCLLFSALVSALSFYGGFYFVGSILCLLLIGVAITCFLYRTHFRSTCALYSAVIPVCRRVNGVIWLVLLFAYAIVYLMWGTIYTIAFMCVQQFAVFSDLLGLLSLAYVIFSWYWTTKVIKNITGVISGSIIGKWYFYQSEPLNAIKSGKETSICSFGSICLAALIIPPVSVINAINQSSFCKSLDKSQSERTVYAQCNRYAYTHICIYGSTLFDASIDALTTFERSGFKSILDAAAIGVPGTIASVTTGAIGSLVAGMLGLYDTDYGGTLIVVAFLTGYGLADVVVETLDSCVLVLLMCICEDTSTLSTRAPSFELFLRENYSAECSPLFSRSSL